MASSAKMFSAFLSSRSLNSSVAPSPPFNPPFLPPPPLPYNPK